MIYKNILVINIYNNNATFYYTSLLFTIFNYIIHIFYCLVLVLFHHKSLFNFIYKLSFVLLFKKCCNKYHLRSAELPYANALMTNMIIDHCYIDYINYFTLHSHLIY